MTARALNTPIVLIIFNRPELTQIVFDEIAKAKPPVLLVVGDGPRDGKVGEGLLVQRTREIIKKVNWNCKVLINYSDVNLGCKKRVSSGLDWAFSLVNEAIILEDDCLPSPSFFNFCQEMLQRFRESDQILQICGTNLADKISYNCSYYFSIYPHIWGWATWRRAWNLYDVNFQGIENFKDFAKHKMLQLSDKEILFWLKLFSRVKSGKINTWDAQLTFCGFKNQMLSVYPAINLISNIGFGEDATHTKKRSDLSNRSISDVVFPLDHPKIIERNYDAEKIRKSLEGIGKSRILRVFNTLRERVFE